jgi:hypothetical protein
LEEAIELNPEEEKAAMIASEKFMAMGPDEAQDTMSATDEKAAIRASTEDED